MIDKTHRCEYVSLLVEAEYIIWLAETYANPDDLHSAIAQYKARRLAMLQKFSDHRLSA